MTDKIKLDDATIATYSYYMDNFSVVCDIIANSSIADKECLLLAFINQKLVTITSDNPCLDGLIVLCKDSEMYLEFGVGVESILNATLVQNKLRLNQEWLIKSGNDYIFNYDIYNKKSRNGYVIYKSDDYPKEVTIKGGMGFLEIEDVLNKYAVILDKKFKFKKLKRLEHQTSYNNVTMNKNNKSLTSYFGLGMFLRNDSVILKYQPIRKQLLSKLDSLVLKEELSGIKHNKQRIGFKV